MDLADPLPVGPTPFPPEGSPAVRGALVVLECAEVERIELAPGVTGILGVVRSVTPSTSGSALPLIRFDRRYRTLEPEEAGG